MDWRAFIWRQVAGRSTHLWTMKLLAGQKWWPCLQLCHLLCCSLKTWKALGHVKPQGYMEELGIHAPHPLPLLNSDKSIGVFCVWFVRWLGDVCGVLSFNSRSTPQASVYVVVFSCFFFFWGGGGRVAFFFLSETIVFKWDIKKTRKASLLTEIICIIFCVFLCRRWSVKDTDAWLFVSAIQQAIPAQGAWWSCSVLSPLESGKKFVFHWAAICLYACLSVCLSVFWIDILSLLSLMNMYLHTVIYTQCTT